MRAIENIARKAFFYGAFVLATVAVIEKVANILNYTILRASFTPFRLLEFAAIGLLFSIVMQLHQIRLLLSSKTIDSQR